MARKPTVISLFSGAGGLDLGIEAAGFRHGVTVEMDTDAVRTLRANRPWRVLDRDIHTIPSSELLEVARLQPGEPDLLIGGPPCQPFSKSGFWCHGDVQRLEDPRAATLEAYLRVLRETKPKAFLLENVPGLAFSDKDEGLVLLTRTIEEINRSTGTSYSFAAMQLNAVEFGIPQMRERVFVIGHREGKRFRFPAPTHSKPPRQSMAADGAAVPETIPFDREPPLTAWDAIGHISDDGDPELAVRGRWADLLPSIPEGHNYLFHTDRGGGLPIFGWRRHFWSMLLKLAKDRPSWTLTAQPGPAIGPFHWKNRRLSAAELCALQTFPADYQIVGGISSAQRQVGNAVPSALAELLGLEIRRQLLAHQRVRRDLTLLPCRASQTPQPEPTRPVTHQRYLERVGHHEAHPGTGLGRGALARRSAGG